MSTIEAKYIALSHSIRETLPLIEFLDKAHLAIGIKPFSDDRITKCTVFEDNNGCIELAKCPRLRPRTKHIGIKYHHFRSKVADSTVKVLPIDTKDQIADIFTKALPKEQFRFLRKLLLGW